MAAVTVGEYPARYAASADQRLPPYWPYAALAFVVLAFLLVILAMNDGHLIYTLDDPYIHLALSEQLARGHFGIAPQEAASPSSSVLYPILLMPLVGTVLHQFQPFVWGLAALFLTLSLWLRLLRNLVFDDKSRQVFTGVIALLTVLLLNQVGLVFSGMESSLQIACSLAVTVGMIEFLANGRLRWWTVVGILAGPLLRYENLTVSLPAIVLLAWFGRWRLAMLCTFVIASVLVAYSIYCQSIGLPPLPGSLLIKIGTLHASSGGNFLIRQAGHFYISFALNTHLPVLVLIGLLGLNFAWTPGPQRGRERALIAMALLILVPQFVYGGHSLQGRYDVHAWSSGLAIAAYVNRSALQRFVAAMGTGRSVVFVSVALFCLFSYTALMAPLTPIAAYNIYLQQYQMHRFLVDFAKSPAVVNDAGWTAYRNPAGILDIAGLGSEEIRRLRYAGALDAATFQRLVATRGIRLAVVYNSWVPSGLSKDWIALAEMSQASPIVTPAEASVIIYAVDRDAADYLRPLLAQFAATLPRGATLQMLDISQSR